MVYRRHPRCPRVSLLLSPCSLVRTLQGGREGFITLFYKQGNGVGGSSSLLQSQVGPLPPQEPWGLPPAPTVSPVPITNARGVEGAGAASLPP